MRPIRIFGDLSIEFSRLMREADDPRVALTMLLQEGERFPEEDWHITIWIITTALRTGEHALALSALRDGIECGLWYPRERFAKSDFDALRDNAEFAQLVAVCAERESAAHSASKFLVAQGRPPHETHSQAMIIHRNHADAAHCLPNWTPLLDMGWSALMPQSSQIMGPDIHIWDNRELALAEVLRIFDADCQREFDYQIIEPLLWAGFMSGADVALRAAMSAGVTSTGVIAISPVVPSTDFFVPLIDAARDAGLRVYVFVGADDHRCYLGATALVEFLQTNGIATKLHTRPDYTFGIPDDFGDVLAEAVEFIQSGRNPA